MDKWLQSRLTPVKRNNDRWRELSASVEELWDTHFDPSVKSLESARSIFTATEAEVEARLAEMGDQFEVAFPMRMDSKPMAYAQRSYEIHRKDRESTINSILKRDFAGAVIGWQRLYGLKSEPYGMRFVDDFDIYSEGIPDDELWLPSRGQIVVNLSDAHRYGYNKTSINDAIARKMAVIKPTHVVYHGVRFLSIYHLSVEPYAVSVVSKVTRNRTDPVKVNPFAEISLDTIPLDDVILDSWVPFNFVSSGHSRFETPVAAFYLGKSILSGAKLASPITLLSSEMAVPGALKKAMLTADITAADLASSRSISLGSLFGYIKDLGSLHQGGSKTHKTISGHLSEGAGHSVSSTSRRVMSYIDPVKRYNLDQDLIDEVSLDRGALIHRVSSSSVMGRVTAQLDHKRWHLDMGEYIAGNRRFVPGIEGDQTKTFFNLGADSSNLIKLPVFSKSSVDSHVKSVVKIGTTTETVSGQQQAIGKKVFSLRQGKKPARVMPSLDSVPLDFAPLDMRYG